MAGEESKSLLSEHEVRVQKIDEMRKKGIEPWASHEEISAKIEQVKKENEKDLTEKEYAIAGRLMTIRGHGKTIFCNLMDSSGTLQIYIKSDLVGADQFSLIENFVDIGDIVWVKGSAFRTKVGELTLRVKELKFLTKCLHPLPEKFHGLADIEIKYRQRYLDLITSTQTRERFKKRSSIVRFLRSYLDEHDYSEVETPMLHPIPGGATARPFVTHHNALDIDLYLRVAPELYLKRLVIGGMERVYELNRNFRNEGVSTRHNPEFTMLEFYAAHKDYKYIMDFCENMIKKLVQKVCGSLEVEFGDKKINFGNFRYMNPLEAVVEFGKISKDQLTPEKINETLKKCDLGLDLKKISYQEKVFALFEEYVEEKITDPVFIVDFPIEISPLAKQDPENPEIAARFELFVAGMELANGFNELNDPFDQAERFKKQAAEHEGGDEEAMRYDSEFIAALEYGLPPTVGVGIGIDRLTMLLTNTTSIKEVILFPTMKKK